MNIIQLYRKIKFHFIRNNSDKYIEHLKKSGIEIGKGNVIQWNCNIDETRPSLVTIGDNNFFSTGFTLLTHDWCSHVFRNKFHDFLNSSGKVSIGNNVYIATNVTLLKGVTIGDNCIIGAGSVVNKSIPANSVAVGVPCRVVSTIDEYYRKCKPRGIEEAKEYVRCFRERNGRNPKASELWEEFIFFVDKRNINQFPEMPIGRQLGAGYDDWIECHHAPFASLEDFLASID